MPRISATTRSMTRLVNLILRGETAGGQADGDSRVS